MIVVRSKRLHCPTEGDAGALLVSVGLILALDGGCATVCSDDGFAWQQDPSCLAQASQTEATTESQTAGPTETDTLPTTSSGGQSYCTDQDGDGFGDPNACTDVPGGGEPPPGTVPNGDDCDDASDTTFPGAAPNDDPDACMKDEDGDDWGDTEPSGGGGGGVVPGSDCDDASSDTFPGAAPNDDPDACMKDEDGDDWGDQNPPGGGGGGGGIVPGTDCDDVNMNAWAACGACVDGDGDGWFAECDAYPPDFPGSDCDDGDPNTFPGAAPNDDADACMTDEDGDDWGDDSPQDPDAVPGTDCDDASDATFPGSAPLDDADACMADEDGDDHGDAHPDNPGVTAGNDCNDDHAGVNPTDSVLITAPITTGDISEVDIATGGVTPLVSIDVSGFNPWIPTSVAVNPVDRSIFAALAFKDRLVTMNYCGAGMPTALPAAHKKNICGIAFDRTGNLYGIDGQVDQLLMFNADGSLASVKPLTFEGATLNVAECGMTYDCHEDRLLVSDSASSAIYTVDPADGTATKVANVPDELFGAGLAYDPVSRHALSCIDTSFLSIAVDGTDMFTKLPDLQEPVDDLDFAPGCN